MEATTETVICRRGKFELDSITEEPVSGYTRDERWNGWACPYFDKSGADDLIAQLNKSYAHFGEPRRAFYDTTRDVYVTPYDGGDEDEWDTWGAQTIVVEGNERVVYPIGAFCWCWIERAPNT